MSKLYIVATPIGNLKDITLRALHVLENVDLILCEDTRVTKKLLNHYNIETPVESYHQPRKVATRQRGRHSKLPKFEKTLNWLREGKNIALTSDSGTPGISDPGNEMIQFLVSRLPNLEIVSIPGPSALTAIASVSGFPMDKFVFFGFPPHKKGRNKFFKEVAEYKYSVILYESPHRIIKTLNELEKLGEFDIVVGRELTKKFETIYRGNIKDIIKQIKPKGEFVIVIRNKS